MKQRIISLLLVLALLTGCLPAAMATAAGAVQWPGTGNFVDNNQVTDAPTAESAAGIEEKWAYALNQTVDSWGAYYAGQTVIADGFLYATGGERLHEWIWRPERARSARRRPAAAAGSMTSSAGETAPSLWPPDLAGGL